MRRSTLLLAAATALVASAAHARGSRVGANQLLRVITPSEHGAASAHPFVNVVVRYGQAKNGAVPDPQSFRARLGRANITALFQPIVENGKEVGKRAAVDQPPVHAGSHPVVNRLRLSVRSLPVKGHVVHDVDRVRFRAQDMPDHPPDVHASPSSDVIFPGLAVQFDASESTDRDGDELSFQWDFGDGTMSTDPRPTHTYAACTTDVSVRVTVTDGQMPSTLTMNLLCAPKCDAGKTKGTLLVDAPQSLEFNVVAPGTSATRTFTVHNTSTVPGSQVKAELALDQGGSFSLSPATVDLGPGESAPVTLTFAPTATGHQEGEVVLVACAANQGAVHLLAHGYGGTSGGGTGPTFAATTLYYLDFIKGPFGILPDGTRFFADNTLHTCRDPNGLFTGDVCVVDGDCPDSGATCPASATCVGGDVAGQPCTQQTDCPHGICPSFNTLDPVDFCSNGRGDLYLLSDDGTYTDPNPNRATELSETVLHLRFDARGNRTLSEILARETTQTQFIACDGAGTHGRVYLPEYHNFTGPQSCFRDATEAVVALDQQTGQSQTLVPRIDAVEGLSECNDDLDPSQDLEVTRDGSAAFVTIDPGLYRVYPTPLFMLDFSLPADAIDFFQMHPDGSVLFVKTTDTGTTGLVNLYKVSPEQAIHGALRPSDLTPCATFQVPNNGGRTLLYNSYAADRTGPASLDGIVIVSFATNGGTGGPSAVLSQSLGVRGTVAFSAPATSDTCSALGLVNLEFLDTLTF